MENIELILPLLKIYETLDCVNGRCKKSRDEGRGPECHPCRVRKFLTDNNLRPDSSVGRATHL